jgi:protein TonB
MNTITSAADLNDLVFLNKNKEYGAYFLRKNYDKYLTMAFFFTISIFLLAISSPIILSYLRPAAPPAQTNGIYYAPTIIDNIPSIDPKKTDVEKLPGLTQLKSTLAFRTPVIKPDPQVIEDYIPSQVDLQTSQPGFQTVKGTGADVVDIPIEIPTAAPKDVRDDKPEIFRYVEEMPTFPGGSDAFLTFVAQNIRYPEIAKRAGVEGRVAISFVVSPSGNVSDVQVAKSIGAGCDEEAVRVIKSMPKWNPGKQNGRPVNVQISVPIIFRLQ